MIKIESESIEELEEEIRVVKSIKASTKPEIMKLIDSFTFSEFISFVLWCRNWEIDLSGIIGGEE